jgi:hypothetical protein
MQADVTVAFPESQQPQTAFTAPVEHSRMITSFQALGDCWCRRADVNNLRLEAQRLVRLIKVLAGSKLLWGVLAEFEPLCIGKLLQ